MAKQIKFPENQTHSKKFEQGMLAFSVLCIVFVIIAVNTVAGGSFG